MLSLGYPFVPPGPKCNGCIYGGGVGQDWVQPVPQTRPMFTSTPGVLSLEAALPEGEFRIEHYLRIWGRWYKVVGRASVALVNGGTRIEMTPYPAEAYPLPDLPEIYLYDKLPPAMMSAVCAQPGAERFKDKDPWAPAAPRPYYALYTLNALQRISYDGGRLLGSGYREPRGDEYEYCPFCATYYAVLEDMDYYYDVFVRFVNDEPRQKRAYGLWWRLYNPRPLRVHKNPDGTYTCENFDAENLRAFEGPFTEAELRSRYGIDPANPPERYVGPR